MNIKLIIWLFFLFIPLIGYGQKSAKIQWKNKNIEMQNVDRNQEYFTVSFGFQSIGDIPLTIHKVKASCQCTKVEWPKSPLQKGEYGEIKIIYRINKNKGYFDKRFFVESNIQEGVSLLRLRGNIK